MATRIERDSMGEMEVPESAYYGASTARAVRNFPISDLRLQRTFIQALGLIKAEAAKVNAELGLLDEKKAEAIHQAAMEVARARFDHEFVVDVFQTGSGTSTNMNANEVIANRAAEVLGGVRGSKAVHPNDHVNLGQSSNDVIPSALHIAALLEIQEHLEPALRKLQKSLAAKAEQFWSLIKTGRTHLQDATPVRMGQEFLGYAGQVERALRRLGYAKAELAELPLGGTAVGTGVNTHPEFAKRVCERLARATGLHLVETENHFQAQASLDAIAFAGGALKAYASGLMKLANDIRWMGAGPRANLNELDLPAVQPGSSIMPGKVNPVICESVIMVCAHVTGADLAVTIGNQWGQFELNTMMPLMAYNLLESLHITATASANFAEQCIDGLTATGKGPQMVERGLMLGTALAPAVGYDKAAEIAKAAAKSNRTIREVAKEKTELTDAELDRLLDPEHMTQPSAERIGSGGG
ncbi:MAG TPA: class II fumarate hydratase [Limnochordia bacterium]|nr:class II fumarate hydratase [Limnochordia bacterium]